MFRGVGQRPVMAVLVGAVAIAFSGILFRLAHVSASTGAFYRCVFALPPLWLLARLEARRYGRQRPRAVALAWIAGAFFAADLVLWHNGIEQVGAGLATVLGNTQVVLVGLLAWAILGDRPAHCSPQRSRPPWVARRSAPPSETSTSRRRGRQRAGWCCSRSRH